MRGRWARLALSAVLCLASAGLLAEDSPRFGFQVGGLVPASPDLRLTTGGGLAPAFGLRVEWGSREEWGSRLSQTLRLRVDAARFREGRQVSDVSGLHQVLTTKVRYESLGLEQLFYENRWSLGWGVHGLHWTVDSQNQLETPSGTFAPAGSSHWTRLGLSLVAGRQWTKHAEVELRFLSSHYGQENQPTSVVSLNFVWTF
ncbi:hypothetical protein GETHLI_29220 [Geothrix limicola]|uniref:Outer membrane protein beta-barrel domain-containing protein n=1 Tax=Geothrix limicola TaxID=2927978 RepID=A0ABQ5QJR5_9BACT|nr:hypothetical protein [Geothrix limicola]GLH74420.1 hypothetical protein GETHLI_29220 [Geothrix limicola]